MSRNRSERVHCNPSLAYEGVSKVCLFCMPIYIYMCPCMCSTHSLCLHHFPSLCDGVSPAFLLVTVWPLALGFRRTAGYLYLRAIFAWARPLARPTTCPGSPHGSLLCFDEYTFSISLSLTYSSCPSTSSIQRSLTLLPSRDQACAHTCSTGYEPGALRCRVRCETIDTIQFFLHITTHLPFPNTNRCFVSRPRVSVRPNQPPVSPCPHVYDPLRPPSLLS